MSSVFLGHLSSHSFQDKTDLVTYNGKLFQASLKISPLNKQVQRKTRSSSNTQGCFECNYFCLLLDHFILSCPFFAHFCLPG